LAEFSQGSEFRLSAIESYASFEARQSFPFHLCSGESTARVIDLTARVIDFNKEKILKELEKKTLGKA